MTADMTSVYVDNDHDNDDDDNNHKDDDNDEDDNGKIGNNNSFPALHRRQLLISIYTIIGNLRTTTTALSTTTRSELQCTAQARLVNFLVVVSSTTPNIVESRRPSIHKFRQV